MTLSGPSKRFIWRLFTGSLIILRPGSLLTLLNNFCAYHVRVWLVRSVSLSAVACASVAYRSGDAGYAERLKKAAKKKVE